MFVLSHSYNLFENCHFEYFIICILLSANVIAEGNESKQIAEKMRHILKFCGCISLNFKKRLKHAAFQKIWIGVSFIVEGFIMHGHSCLEMI